MEDDRAPLLQEGATNRASEEMGKALAMQQEAQRLMEQAKEQSSGLTRQAALMQQEFARALASQQPVASPPPFVFGNGPPPRVLGKDPVQPVPQADGQASGVAPLLPQAGEVAPFPQGDMDKEVSDEEEMEQAEDDGRNESADTVPVQQKAAESSDDSDDGPDEADWRWNVNHTTWRARRKTFKGRNPFFNMVYPK